ncbi:MAG TPA: family 10 glycosylhydrolase [Vicinamibacterales bacterium]|nr:family 10 glycosylhydrolase [Vicinamibacterales bacterium]
MRRARRAAVRRFGSRRVDTGERKLLLSCDSMRDFGSCTRLVRALAALAGLASVGLPATPARRTDATTSEVRALWVLRTSLSTPQSIATLVSTAREHGFNTLLVQVRGRGDRYYAGGLEPRAAELHRQPAGFDPLAEVLAAARGADLRVHAWVNVNLVSSAVDLPLSREHIVHRHPEWLMVPRDIAQELARVDQRSPAYVGRLARWTRAQSGEVEGLYASPLSPGAADHAEAIVRDLARRYRVDGVHLDYARYPNARFDYSRGAIREFRAAARPKLGVSRRRQLDERERLDFLAYPDGLAEEWKAFRLARMTALMSRLRAAVKAVRPQATVTVAAAPDLREAYDQRLQDWRTWLENGLVDAVCPMAYTPEPAQFAQQITAARDVAGGKVVWAGIGAYRLTPSQTIENIQTARRLGAAGVVLFSYDSLTDPRKAAPDYLSVIGRSAFSAAPDVGSR